MATRPFPTNARLTAIALAFRNPDIALIADLVLPRTPVAYEFKWLSYDLAQGYTVPDTRVGRKSAPNEIDFQATEVQDKCQDFGLDDLVPNEDIEADNQGVDPLGTATGFLSNLVDLGREQRVANLVFNAANLAGAVLLLISLSVNFNLAAFVMESAWGVIALFGLVSALRKRSVRP